MSPLLIIAIAGCICLFALMIASSRQKDREQMRRVADEWSVRHQRKG